MSLCLESMSYILNIYVLLNSLTRRRDFHFFLAVWGSPGEEELGLVPHREEELGDVVVRVTVHALTDTNTDTSISTTSGRPNGTSPKMGV